MQPQAPRANPEEVQQAVETIGRALVDAFRRPRKPRQDPAISLWVIGLVPILFACLHLMIVARGDPETLRSLVQNLNVTALILATALPLGSTAVTWIFLFFVLTVISRPRGQREGSNPWATCLLLFGLTAVVDFFAMPASYGAINLAILAVLILYMVVGRFRSHLPKSLESKLTKFFSASGRAFALLFILGPLLIWLCFSGVWLPQERLNVNGRDISPTYVLSMDERWTKYMDSNHKVHIVATPDIRERDTVDVPRSKWRETFYTWWREPNPRKELPSQFLFGRSPTPQK
jgi:hypothetical protein